MLEFKELELFDIDVKKIFIQFECKKCGKTWGLNLYSIKNKLPDNAGICLSCAAQEMINKKRLEKGEHNEYGYNNQK